MCFLFYGRSKPAIALPRKCLRLLWKQIGCYRDLRLVFPEMDMLYRILRRGRRGGFVLFIAVVLPKMAERI